MASGNKRYRAIKERLEVYRNDKDTHKPLGKEATSTPVEQYLADPVLTTDAHITKSETTARLRHEESQEPPTTQQHPNRGSNSWLTLTLKSILWLLLLGFFIEIEFGVAFLITSFFYFMYAMMRGSRRKPWELSAYSVFNKNCERIEGTLGAEQFEQELRYGPTSVHR